MKTDLFQSCGHCWVFQIFWHIECSTFTASSFRIWNRSTWIPSPPLALFVVMLPKVHLTSHSRMSGSRWVITPSWLSGSWRPFLYSFSVYSCHLFLISSASVQSIPFLSFIEPIFAWNAPLVSLIFLMRSLVFPILLFSSISLHWSLRKAFLSLPIPANLENSAVKKKKKLSSGHRTGKGQFSFQSQRKRQSQRMFKLLHNCPHLTCQQSNAQNSPS